MKKKALFWMLCMGTVQALVAQSNYNFANTAITQTTFTDISISGTSIAMTNAESGASASPIDIGFPFSFNNTSFTQCMIHADGILRFGTVAPGAATSIAANNAGAFNAVFTSTSSSFSNVVLPFFTDLVASSGQPAAYHVQVSGTAPNRVCTIQWSNLRDANNSGSTGQQQFSNIRFQVRLFETSNHIAFVYGSFQPSDAENTAQRRNAAAGIKASSTSFIAALRQESIDPFDRITFLNPANNARLTNAFPYRKSIEVPAGTTLFFYGQRSNDVGIGNVYYDSLTAKGNMGRGQLAVLVNNFGTSPAANVKVSLQVSGANTHSADTTIAAMPAGTSAVVTFPSFSLPNIGAQQVEAQATLASDETPENNQKTRRQLVTNAHTQVYSASRKMNIGVGFNNTTNSISLKMYGEGTRSITQVRIPFSSYRSRVRMRIFAEDPATGLGISPALFTTADFTTTSENDFIIPITPAVTVTGNYFIMLEQLTTTNMAWRIALDNPLRVERNRNGLGFQVYNNSEPWQVLAEVYEVQAGHDVGMENLVDPGCDLNNPIDVKAVLRNFSSAQHNFAATPVTISGKIRNHTGVETSFSFVKNSGLLAPGAADTIVLQSNYDLKGKGVYTFSARTILPTDAVPGNDSLIHFFTNSLRLTPPVSESVCPLTPVTVVPPSTIYTNRTFAYDNLSGNVTGNITITPLKTTVVYFTGDDYRDCKILDSVVINVKTTGLPPMPSVMFGDTVLTHRRNFKDTLTIPPLAGHTPRFFTNTLGIVNSNPFQINNIVALNGFQVTPVYTNTADGCSNTGQKLTYSYGKGVLHGSSLMPLAVCDTTYYDAGGPTQITNTSGTQTFIPAQAGKMLELSIYRMGLSNNETIKVYDGLTNAAPLLVTYFPAQSGNTIRRVRSSNPAGALTVEYTSNGGGAEGWWAGITCFDRANYRTIATGSWNNPAIWEQQTAGGSFVPATRYPNYADDTITVRHDVSLTTAERLDQVIVNPGSELLVTNAAAITAGVVNQQLTYDIRGNLTVTAGVNISGGTMHIKGNLANFGLIDIDTIHFNGNIPQSIGLANSGGRGIIRVLCADNEAGINFLSFMDVRGIHFVRGLINTVSNGYPIVAGANNLNGASSTRYVNGPLSVNLGTPTGTRFYPIGKNGAYRPVEISNTASANENADELRVEVISGPPTTRTLPASITNISAVRYYRIFRLGTSGSQYRVKLSYGADDGVANHQNLVVLKDLGAAWINLGGTASGPTPGTIESGVIDAAAFTVNNEVVLAGLDGALPATGFVLSGNKRNGQHQLTWQTLSEQNTSHFDIEQSANGIHFSSIGTTAAKGNSTLPSSYFFNSKPSHTPTSYYRIKLVDKDGSISFSNTILLESDLWQSELRVYPNPATTHLQVDYGLSGQTVIATIINSKGQQVQALPLQGKTIPVGSLPSGIYLLRISDGKTTKTIRFVKQ